jgi:tight adherence protein B
MMVAGAGVAVVFIFFAVASSVGSPKKKIFDSRLSRVKGGGISASSGNQEDQVSLRLHQNDSSIPFIDNLIKRYLPQPDILRTRLERTGLKFKISTYILISVVIAGAIGLPIFKIGAFSAGISALMGISGGLMWPHFIVNILINRRLKAFTAEFPEAIDLIVRGLKSGLPIPASIRTVAEEIGGPIGKEFAIVTDRLRIGETLEDALQFVARRVPTPDFRFFVTSLAVQRETGGNLAETLGNLSDVLRKRRQMKLKIKAMSSEAKASAWILGSLPFLMFGIMMVMNSEYVMALFSDPRGLMMVAGGFASLFTGILVMAKMVRFEI